jgi:FtsH-binding integral membrane protein
MKNNKNGLDEMQKERRNSIGNQMFMLMFYALLLNGGLYAAGIRWLEYPANVLVIITACMGIYLVRLIALNAYLPPKAQSRKPVVTLVIAIVFSVAFTMAAINLFTHYPAQVAESTEDNSAVILFIVSAVGLLATIIVAVIKKVNSKNDNDE